MKLFYGGYATAITGLLSALEEAAKAHPEANELHVELEQHADGHQVLNLNMELVAGEGLGLAPAGATVMVCQDFTYDPAQWIEVEGEVGEKTIYKPNVASVDKLYRDAADEALRLLLQAVAER